MIGNQPKIPDPQTRASHIAKLRELNKRMDKHILDLDGLNSRLEIDLLEQRKQIYTLRQTPRA